MPFTAAYDTISSGYVISEMDPDGVGGEIRARVFSSGLARDIKLAADISRLALLALNMDGGMARATELLRGEVVRQKTQTL
jgi:hypothetical protein